MCSYVHVRMHVCMYMRMHVNGYAKTVNKGTRAEILYTKFKVTLMHYTEIFLPMDAVSCIIIVDSL